jgi:hypothetical protein
MGLVLFQSLLALFKVRIDLSDRFLDLLFFFQFLKESKKALEKHEAHVKELKELVKQ